MGGLIAHFQQHPRAGAGASAAKIRVREVIARRRRSLGTPSYPSSNGAPLLALALPPNGSAGGGRLTAAAKGVAEGAVRRLRLVSIAIRRERVSPPRCHADRGCQSKLSPRRSRPAHTPIFPKRKAGTPSPSHGRRARGRRSLAGSRVNLRCRPAATGPQAHSAQPQRGVRSGSPAKPALAPGSAAGAPGSGAARRSERLS